MSLSPAAGPPEPGRALIARDLLPAAPPPPARPPRRPAAPPDPSGQLSLFGVESVDASPADLAGLLAGVGRLSRMGGTARVSVQVDAAWRVHALLAELSARGLEATWLPTPAATPDTAPPEEAPPDTAPPEEAPPDVATPDEAAPDEAAPGEAAPGEAAPDEDSLAVDPAGGRAGGSGAVLTDHGDAAEEVVRFEVRTAYSSMLAGLAGAWLDGTAKRAPRRFLVTGPRLRLWIIAAGSPHRGGYDLGLGPDDAARVWPAVAAALARAGLPGEVHATAAGGPVYRITGRRRLARLAELVGDRPRAAPPGAWPQT